jgi:hypothetical protein
MQYRVFYTDQPPPPAETQSDRTPVILVGYDTKEGAMGFPFGLLRARVWNPHIVVRKIEGLDGCT